MPSLGPREEGVPLGALPFGSTGFGMEARTPGKGPVSPDRALPGSFLTDNRFETLKKEHVHRAPEGL